jgi:hypothetical protein
MPERRELGLHFAALQVPADPWPYLMAARSAPSSPGLVGSPELPAVAAMATGFLPQDLWRRIPVAGFLCHTG